MSECAEFLSHCGDEFTSDNHLHGAPVLTSKQKTNKRKYAPKT